MKGMSLYISERLKFSKGFKVSNEKPKDHEELLKAIKATIENRKDDEVVDLSHLDVSNVCDFSFLFLNLDTKKLGLPEVKEVVVDTWDVSNGTNFNGTFYYMESMERAGLSKWDTGNAVCMNDMFCRCMKFNEDISAWDVSNVTTMEAMFEDCYSFAQDLSEWDVSNVRDFDSMFKNARKFNSDISKWNMESAQYARSMLEGCISFDRDLTGLTDSLQYILINNIFKGCNNLKDLPKWYVDLQKKTF